jgi:effector-binding domain-containing protein
VNLTLEPEVVVWPKTHFVYVERVGPFLENAPQAWQSLHQLLAGIAEHNKITGYMSLYKGGPQIYRAGVSLASGAEMLPEGVAYDEFAGGSYRGFVLRGPYTDLPEASGRVFELVAEKGVVLRDDYCIENYVNDPRTTPEDQLVTHILLPVG